MINIAIALILFLKSSFFSSCFPSLLHGSFPVRQWSKSEESYSLTLWFPKKDLEKQVSWIKLSESFNINPYFSIINTWFFCPLLALFSTDHWICPCSNTMLAVPPSSFSASFWFRYLSLRSEYCLISLSTERLGLISLFLYCFIYSQKTLGMSFGVLVCVLLLILVVCFSTHLQVSVTQVKIYFQVVWFQF